MKNLTDMQIKSAIFELAVLTGVAIEDLKKEFETAVEALMGKNATYLSDDCQMTQQLQTSAMEKLFRSYKKPRQWIKFLNGQTTEEAEAVEEAEEEDEEDEEE